MSLAPLVLIDNFDSFTYNLFQMIQHLTQHPVVVYRNNAIDFKAVVALKPIGVVLSPGPGHPQNERDFGVCRDVIVHHDKLNVPVLGVCLGHQGIAHHLGGQVIQAPVIMHGKTSPVSVTKPSVLFEGLSEPFEAMRYHSLVVDAQSLPAELEVTAIEKNKQLVMGLQHKTKPIFGVQFHPESIGTPEGKQLLRNFVTQCKA